MPLSFRKYRYLTSMLIFYIIISLILPAAVYINSTKNTAINTSADVTKKRTIILDAGHGGEDCGAIGIGNIYEKDLNMQITMKIGEYLSAAGYNVIYTRTEDALLYTDEENIKGMRKIYDLRNRVKIANSYDDALFISIHMNSFGAENCSGLQIYYSAEDSEARNAALKVRESVIQRLQPSNNRNIKEGKDIYVLENSENPALLIECGFISNQAECKKLSEKEYQKELSFAIICGIIEYDKQKGN